MARRNEEACAIWEKYLILGYPSLISRNKAAKMLGTSDNSIKELIANGELVVDEVSNKIKLYSIAKFQCSRG